MDELTNKPMNELIALIEAHLPSISDADELALEDRRYNSDVDRFGQPAVDVADLALRTCKCGVKVDGFYQYVDHLIAVIQVWNYPWDLDLAESRGWDRNAHMAALASRDENEIGLTHPTNWLTEAEVG